MNKLNKLLKALLFLSQVTFSQAVFYEEEADSYSDWDLANLDTAKDIDWMTDPEKSIVLEMNMVRTDPKRYAEQFLIPLLDGYEEDIYTDSDGRRIKTREGIKALQECIKALEVAKPAPILYPERGLYLSATDHAKDQAKTGKTGHDGSDGSTSEVRMDRYGYSYGAQGENIDYGNNHVRAVICSLLIDDGVPNRGHRINILYPAYTQIGAVLSSHKVYTYMCVMNYGSEYKSK
jgi:uncharacterized protein YkwD